MMKLREDPPGERAVERVPPPVPEEIPPEIPVPPVPPAPGTASAPVHEPDQMIHWKIPFSLLIIYGCRFMANRSGDPKWLADRDEVEIMEKVYNDLLDKWAGKYGKFSEETTAVLVTSAFFVKRLLPAPPPPIQPDESDQKKNDA